MNVATGERTPIPTIDPTTQRSLDELAAGLAALPPMPTDRGRVVLICSRLDGDVRWLPQSIEVESATGLAADRWHRGRADGEAKYKQDYANMQVATMQAPVAELVANGQPLHLFGDNLFLDLDLSQENLPAGSRLRIGGATFEVTPFPHNGCKKFHARFGADALRFVQDKETRHRNLRGIYLRVVENGTIACGDEVVVISR